MAETPMIFYPYNYCLNCKTNNIELYSWHNYGQGFAKMVNAYIFNGTLPNIDKYGIYTMRCKNCGKEYKIIWEENKMPRPVTTNLTPSMFMNKYKQESLKGRPKIIDNVYLKQLPDLK